MIKAHPTVYQGVRFRSRLEATWAAFFDLTGIMWEYEPIDFKGWSPDFALSLPDLPTVFVEVKPAPLNRSISSSWLDALGEYPWKLSALYPGFEKAKKHRSSVFVLLLGRLPNSHSHALGIGTLLDPPQGSPVMWIDVHKALCPKDAWGVWAEAKNRTQWRAA